MNRYSYLSAIADRLTTVVRDPGFDNQLNQVRSKSLLSILAPETVSTIAYNYSSERLLRTATFVAQNAVRLIEEGIDLTGLSDELRRSAQVLEHLAELEEGSLKPTTALMSATLYQLAGFEANALCMARTTSQPNIMSAAVSGSASLLIDRWTNLSIQRQFVKLLREIHQIQLSAIDQEAQFVEALDSEELHADAIVSLAQSLMVCRVFSSLSTFALRGAFEAYAENFHDSDALEELLTRTGQAPELMSV